MMTLQMDPQRIVKGLESLPMWLMVIVVPLVVGLAQHFMRRKRLPNAPTLKISSRPGALGVMDDIRSFVTESPTVFAQGYEKYSKKGINYIINTPMGKSLILAPKFVDELRSAPDSHVSVMAEFEDFLQVKFILHGLVLENSYHLDVPIRKSITQHIGPMLPEIVKEGKLAMDKFIGQPTGTLELPLVPLGFKLVTRTANRFLFGRELAHNDEFLDFSISYTNAIFKAANRIRSMPTFLKPLAVWWHTTLYKDEAVGRKYLLPLIKQRIAEEDRYIKEGKQDEWQKVKSDDCIQWILDVTPPSERVAHRLIYRLFQLNVAVVHTSSGAFQDVVYCLAFLPELQDELREEIKEVFTKEGGWSKQGLTHLTKVDSVLKESARWCGSTATKMRRKTIRDWTLSDGSIIPTGTSLCTTHISVCFDPEIYENPMEFDGLRFWKKRQVPGEESKHQLVMTTPNSLQFGHGKHACPGRFFASNELKVLLVLLLMRFDFTMDLDGGLDTVRKGIWYNDVRAQVPDGILKLKPRERWSGDKGFFADL